MTEGIVETTEAPVTEQPRDDQGRFAEETPAEEAVAEEETPDDGEEEAVEGEDLPGGKKRGKSAEARIAELTRNWRETQRELALVKGLVSQPTQVSSQEDAPKPAAEDFGTYDEWIDALTDWKVDQKLAKSSQEHAQRTAGSIQQASWATKVEAAHSTLPDYANVVGSSEVPVASHVAEALMDAERGPELAYHMAQHPDVAERLNSLPPMKAAMELARIEAQLSAPVVKPMTKAPAPVNPLRPAPSRQADLGSAAMDDYIETRKKQGASWAR